MATDHKTKIIEAAERYLDLHISVVPIAPGTKAPVVPSWNKLRLTFPDFPKYFENGQQLGALMGIAPDYHGDLDVDDPKALIVVTKGLIPGQPRTGWVFGRKSKPRSHYIYKLTGEFTSVSYADHIDPKANESRGEKRSHMLVEIRGTSQQTVFPPSVHASGEPIEWNAEPEPSTLGETDLSGLDGWARRVAVATLLARHYPAFGQGHALALAVSGWLALNNWKEENVASIVVAAAIAAGDPDVHERRRNVSSTYKRINDGNDKVEQRKHLEQLLGDNGKAICKLIAKWLALRGTENLDPNQVLLEPGRTPEAVDSADEILAVTAASLGIFQRGGQLFRVTAIPQPREGHGLTRPAGTVILDAISRAALLDIFDRAVGWNVRRRPTDDDPKTTKRVSCPARVADSYLARTGTRRVPVLRDLIFTPLLRADGTILSKHGFDEETGFYLVPDGDTPWPNIPSDLKIEDARTALENLKKPFEQFPFVGEEDRAVHLSAILTSIQRRQLPSAPMHSYSAPQQRMGKSLLAESVAIIGIGRAAPATAVSRDQEELRKAIVSVLLEGHAIVNLDNVETALSNPVLAAVITGEEFSDRLLGSNKSVRLPTRVLWLATGNNLTFKGDLTVRTLVATIDVALENPEEREFRIPNLKQYLVEHRRELIVAALTILRAYRSAKSPIQKDLKTWGGFDEWCREVRDPLVWAGCADPCKTRKMIVDNDPERQDAAALLTELRIKFCRDKFKLSELIQILESGNDNKREVFRPELLLTVKAVAERFGKVDRNKLGWWFRRWSGHVVGGLRLTAGRNTGRGIEWHVEERQGESWV